MLKITRYINGIKVDEEKVSSYAIESDAISRAIGAVNRRLEENAE